MVHQIDLSSIYELIPKTKNIFVTIMERKPSEMQLLMYKWVKFEKTGRSTVHYGDVQWFIKCVCISVNSFLPF